MKGLGLLITLAIGFLVASLAVEAQRKEMPVIGYLHFASPSLAPTPTVFLQGLSEAGYVEGQNVAIEYRWAEGRYDRLPALAKDLVDRQVDVIAAFGPPAAHAAHSATSTIPIVFAVGTDPVADGLVASLARPGGNLTGRSLLAVDLVPKRLELLAELVPQATVVALLVNPTNAYTEPMIRDVQEAARAKRVQLPILKATTASEIDTAFATLANLHADALVTGDDPFFVIQRKHIVALAARQAVPAMTATLSLGHVAGRGRPGGPQTRCGAGWGRAGAGRGARPCKSRSNGTVRTHSIPSSQNTSL
jgi:putative ABC transport system substrate-binding protein